MSILDRIVELLGEQDQKKLTDYLHLKKSAFTDWKSGKSNSYRKYLIEISEFFGVSIDYLVLEMMPRFKISLIQQSVRWESTQQVQ